MILTDDARMNPAPAPHSETKLPDLRLYAHRGANRIHPENTMPAFERALKDGATHLEMDVHRTADGQIVVHHDATGFRMAGVDKLVAECSYAEIQSWNVGKKFLFGKLNRAYQAPLFRTVLNAFPRTVINVDIKQHEIDVVREVLNLIQDCGAVGRVVLNSFDAEIIRHVRRLGYPGETGVSVQDLMRLRFYPEFLLRRRSIAGHALQLPLHGEGGRGLRRWIGQRVRFDGPRLIRRAHAARLRLDYWVVNDADEARRLLERGADGLMTDEPDKIRDVFYDFARSHDRIVQK
ncbi:MAG: hypothetical protein NXI24_02640 [bacterium]|nr:hypothetical protein [bacterium]